MMVYVSNRVDCSTKPCKSHNMSWYYWTTHVLAESQSEQIACHLSHATTLA